MTLAKKQIQEAIDYWRKTADHDWDTAKSLWKSKRYDACLFYCHLVLEKLLKGLVTERAGKTPPFIHDLVELLKRAGIRADQAQTEKLAAFTGFNMRCRYHQDKLAFYKLCTRQFSEPYFKEMDKLILWLKKFYQEDK